MSSIENQGEKIASLEILKSDSLAIDGLYFKGLKLNVDDLVIGAGSWNENQGVIVYADESGKKFAIPSSENATDLLSKNLGFVKDESIGVPALNNAESWGDENERGESFKSWAKLVNKI